MLQAEAMKTFGEAAIAFRDDLATSLADIGEWMGFNAAPMAVAGGPTRPGFSEGYIPEKTTWQCVWCGSSQAKDRLSCAKCGGTI